MPLLQTLDFELKTHASTTILEKALAVTQPLLDPKESQDLIASCGQLGPDPSSDHFTTRTKNIAYVLAIKGEWFQLRAHCFIQSHQYNDFSGGYKRCYREMPKQFIECDATKKVLNAFQRAFNIPDNEPILVQVQTSYITADNAGQCLTGQGIHSDGADQAILVCLERNSIEGAESAIYADLDGQQTLLKPFILDTGHAMLWHDNQVFHNVQPAQVSPSKEEGSRTVLIAHYPAIHYLRGTTNPNNTLGTHVVDESQRLRLVS